ERTQLTQRLRVRSTPVPWPGPHPRRQLVAVRAPCIERCPHAGDPGWVVRRTILLLVRVRRQVEELHAVPVADEDLRALPEALEHTAAGTAAVLADRAVIFRRAVRGGGAACGRREAPPLQSRWRRDAE